MKGTGMHQFDGFEHVLRRGDVFVLNRNRVHGFKNTHQLVICNIMYTDEIFTNFMGDIKTMEGFQSLFLLGANPRTEIPSKLTLSLDNFNTIERQLLSMEQEFIKKDDGYESLLLAEFQKLCVFLARSYTLKENTVSGNQNVLSLAKVVSFMEKNFAATIKLEELIAMSNVSRRHFLRLFKEF